MQGLLARKGGRRGSAGGNTPWVATGAAADAQYTEARTIARDHMRLRNQFFQQVRLRSPVIHTISDLTDAARRTAECCEHGF